MMNRLHVWHLKTWFCNQFRSMASLSVSKTHRFSCYQSPMPKIAFPTFISWKAHQLGHPTDTWLSIVPSSRIFHHNDSQLIYQVIQSFIELYSDTTWFWCQHRAKRPIYPCLDHLYQEMVMLHHHNKPQGLSTHRHNARHPLSACIVTLSQDLCHTHCHRGLLLLADIIGPY